MRNRIAEDAEPNRWLGVPRRFAPTFEIGKRVTLCCCALLFHVIPRLLGCHSERSEESRTDLCNILRSKCDPSFVGEILRCEPHWHSLRMTKRESAFSFRAKLRSHPIEAREDALFAHDFEHVIQTRPYTATAHRDTGGMDEIAGLAAKFLGKILQSRFKRLEIPIVDLAKLIAQRAQTRSRLRFAKNFFHCLWIELVLFGEKVGRPIRQFAQ